MGQERLWHGTGLHPKLHKGSRDLWPGKDRLGVRNRRLQRGTMQDQGSLVNGLRRIHPGTRISRPKTAPTLGLEHKESLVVTSHAASVLLTVVPLVCREVGFGESDWITGQCTASGSPRDGLALTLLLGHGPVWRWSLGCAPEGCLPSRSSPLSTSCAVSSFPPPGPFYLGASCRGLNPLKPR